MKKVTKQLRISLSEKDAEYLKDVANKLDVKETDVLRQGLKIMAQYARAQDPHATSLILKEGDQEKEFILTL